MANTGVQVAFKDGRIIGFVLTESEAQARVKRGQADYFVWYDFATTKRADGAVIPYLTVKED